MMQNYRLGQLCFVIWMFLPLFMAAPQDGLRYVTGDVSRALEGIDYDENGAFHLGADGVIRSFANDGSVLDYRQLDAAQAKILAIEHITVYKSMGVQVPLELHVLVESDVNGRLVTDIMQLLHPTERPAIPAVATSRTSSVRARKPEDLFKRQGPGGAICYNPKCQSLADCTPANCYACYFPNGPPDGTCFQN